MGYPNTSFGVGPFNVRPTSVNTISARSYATRASLRSGLAVGARAISPTLALKSRFARAVRASPASAPPALCRERAIRSRSRSVPLVKQSTHNRAFVQPQSFIQERIEPSFSPSASSQERIEPSFIRSTSCKRKCLLLFFAQCALRCLSLLIHGRSNTARFLHSRNAKVVLASTKA
jgi:hypothetical protein